MPDTLKTFYQKYAELSDITDTLKTFYNKYTELCDSTDTPTTKIHYHLV